MAHNDRTGNTRVFAFVYFSGHGVTDLSSKIVLNADRKEDRYFALQAKLSIYAGYHNTYIMSLFDCCREELPASEHTRSMGNDDEQQQQENTNYVITFGNRVGLGVPANSVLACFHNINRDLDGSDFHTEESLNYLHTL
jgi:hypothetical protein